jgi:hypothetical protein
VWRYRPPEPTITSTISGARWSGAHHVGIEMLSQTIMVHDEENMDADPSEHQQGTGTGEVAR